MVVWCVHGMVVEVDAGDGPVLYLGSGPGLGAGPHRTSPHTTRERDTGGARLTLRIRLCEIRFKRNPLMQPHAYGKGRSAGGPLPGRGQGVRAKEGQSQERPGDVLS